MADVPPPPADDTGAVALVEPEASGVATLPVADPANAGPVNTLAGFARELRRRLRPLERRAAQRAVLRSLLAVPRTAAFAVRAVQHRLRHDLPDGVPDIRVTPLVLASVAIDETILALAMGPNRYPSRDDYERVGVELTQAAELYAARGWLDDPVSYHRTPTAPEQVQFADGWALGVPYERLSFMSEYEPRREEPGADRWMGYVTNRTATAHILRHRDGPRPWIVLVHGFGTGAAWMDFPAFSVRHLHDELGFNIAAPVLPLHGDRKASKVSGELFLSFDLMNSVHGLAQAVWDIRRTIAWIRATQEPSALAVYGVSLGGYTTALLSGLEPGLDNVVAGIPVSDFPALFRAHSPVNIRLRAIEHHILGGPAEAVHQVVSPLRVQPLAETDRLAIFAGSGDRMARPKQAHELWLHWDRPEMCWYPGNHIGYLWSRDVRRFVRARLGRTLAEVGAAR